MRRLSVGLAGLAVALLAVAGCDEAEKIRTYEAPAPPDPTQTASSEPPGNQRPGPNANAGGGSMGQAPGQGGGKPREHITWDVPEVWQSAKTTSGFQIGRFLIPAGGDAGQPVAVKVTRFPMKGRQMLLANVNRWRRQIGHQQPLSEPPEPVATFTQEPLKGEVYSLVGPGGSTGAESESAAQPAILVAIVRGPEHTWFVKVRDQRSRVEANREAVLTFARSFQLETDEAGDEPRVAASGASGAATRPAGGSPNGRGADAQTPAGVDWQVPEGWQQVAPPNRMVLAAYQTEKAGQTVTLQVTRMRGNAGGILANMNRWRGQLGKQPVQSRQQQPHQHVTINGWEGIMVDMHGDGDNQSRQRMRVVARFGQQESWFFKLTGPHQAVNQAVDGFRAFVQSVIFNGDAS